MTNHTDTSSPLSQVEIYEEDLMKLERVSKSRKQKPEDLLHELILKREVKKICR